MRVNWCFVLIVSFCGTILKANAQDVIFKKNGEVIQVFNLTTTGKSRSYNLPGDAEGTVRFISINAIDSILYANGTKTDFQQILPEPIIQEKEKGQFKRNSLGLDFAAITFYKNIKLSYKYLLGDGTLGLYTSFSKNLNPFNLWTEEQYVAENYSNLMRYLRWNGRAGVDAYIFDPGPFRISGGVHWVTGKYTTQKYQDLDQEPWYIVTKNTNNSMNGILFSSKFLWQPVDFFQFNTGLDIPLYSNPKFRSSFFEIEASFIF
ncbi:hypothetical protein [Mariniphaga sp.]|uniref:hypothetical protein n=1 Tax=Mariniphaga sp. TaxID=1954475 RepID=UPI00356A4BC6